MEPIRKVTAPRTGVEGPEAAHGLRRVEREQRRSGDGEQPRKDRPRPPAQPVVRRDDDGRPHVDVQA